MRGIYGLEAADLLVWIYCGIADPQINIYIHLLKVKMNCAQFSGENLYVTMKLI
jgi:hypothetical protein